MVIAPTMYGGNDRNNDPWDHDAICWMLEQLGPDTSWTYTTLFECARKQKGRIDNDLARVIEAANVCGRLGVVQLDLHDQRLGKDVVRLRRTDPASPEYPAQYDDSDPVDLAPARFRPDEREAAQLLLGALGRYEAELTGAGRSRHTITTYVDRAERFLKRVAGL